MTESASLGLSESASAASAYAPLCEAARQLQVGHIMARDVISISPGDSIQTAAALMAERQVSCLVVMDGPRLIGIITQQSVLKEAAQTPGQAGASPVADWMRAPIPTAGPATPVLEACEIMKRDRVKWLPVLLDAELTGLVTQTDIIRAVTSLVQVIEVGSIMNTNVKTVDAASTVQEAAGIMSTAGISCVVAVHNGKLAGILTERDLLKRVVAPGKDPGHVLVADVMSFPIISVAPCYCLFTAHRMMDRMHVHRLVVMQDEQLCGIVTQTDILRALKDTFLGAEFVSLDED
jgi:predicted transcriptional regulator